MFDRVPGWMDLHCVSGPNARTTLTRCGASPPQLLYTWMNPFSALATIQFGAGTAANGDSPASATVFSGSSNTILATCPLANFALCPGSNSATSKWLGSRLYEADSSALAVVLAAKVAQRRLWIVFQSSEETFSFFCNRLDLH